jgi:hypothetical protein
MLGPRISRVLLLLAWLAMIAASLAVAGEPAPRFLAHTLATGLKGGYQVVPVDLNGDGKVDLIALATATPELLWFENPTWERHVIAAPVDRMINLAAKDIDGDGVPEIVLAGGWTNKAKESSGIVWVLHHNGDVCRPWTVTEIDRLPTSHRIRFAMIDGKPAFVNAPLTGAQAEAPDYRGATPLVFYRPGEWKRETISNENQGVVHGLVVVDWDGDGRDDILTASFEGVHCFRRSAGGNWAREQIVKGSPEPWPKSGASDVAVGQARSGRFIATIEPWHGHQVVVYTRSGAAWQRQVIDDSQTDCHSIAAADLDGDGDAEIIVGVRGPTRRVVIYKSSRQGKEWNRFVIDDGGMAAADCEVADLNGDGRPDLACIGSATANLKWYENLGPNK